jgi:HK97 family phage major capsid protein
MHPKTLTLIGNVVDNSKGALLMDRTNRTINGSEYVLTSLAPSPSANTKIIAFGNFKRAYAIAQRGEGVVSKKVPSNVAFSENVLFAERVDGRIVDPNAFKVFALRV